MPVPARAGRTASRSTCRGPSAPNQSSVVEYGPELEPAGTLPVVRRPPRRTARKGSACHSPALPRTAPPDPTPCARWCCWPWPRCSVSRCPRCWRRPARPPPRRTASGATTSSPAAPGRSRTKGPADTTPQGRRRRGLALRRRRREHPALPRGPPRPSPDICGATPAKAGSKRVGVVIDAGRPADAETGATPPAPVAQCAVVDARASGAEVLSAVASVRVGQGPDLRHQRLPGHRLRRRGQAGPGRRQGRRHPRRDPGPRQRLRLAVALAARLPATPSRPAARRSRAPASRPGPGSGSSSSSRCWRSWRSPRCAAAGPERLAPPAHAPPRHPLPPSPAAAPGSLVAVGARPGDGGLPHDQPVPAAAGRRGRRVGRAGAPGGRRDRRVLAPSCVIGLVAIGLRVLTAGLLGGGVTGRVVLVRLPEVPLPALDRRGAPRRPGDPRGPARGRVRRPAARRHPGLPGRRERARQPAPAAALRARHAVRRGHGRRRGAHLRPADGARTPAGSGQPGGCAGTRPAACARSRGWPCR